MRNKSFTISPLKSRVALLLLIAITTSCDLFKFKTENDLEDDPIMVSVDQQYLRRSDLDLVNTKGLSPVDSANIINRYIQSWIKKQLMIKEAAKTMAFDEAEINRKLLDYKYTLMVYEFEKAYLEKNLDKEISNVAIEEYYEENKKNFSLKEIIVRTNFLKMEKNNNQNRNLERLLRLPEGQQKDAINNIALQQAINYFLEDSTWVRIDDIVVNTPLATNPNLVSLIRNEKLILVEDDRYKYYFRILDYKLQDQIPPLDFVKDEVIKILLNKKRVQLVEELQKEIYNRALENNEFKIYD
ncbi:peptidyl-prolyl cis-trans isomerase [Shivajiella indica]|uniref:Peptidyl-prolyl cis-trans isomerase n=1 Tax=Shivajiella indica TaxID=872115 RepID=A0ABW5B3G8_9BACT